MTRRKTGNDSRKTTASFRFVDFTTDRNQIEKISKALGENRSITGDDLYSLTDAEWKLSISQHKEHGYYTAALTDKKGRKGCSNKCFVVHHNDLDTAIRAAIYIGVEILDAGYEDEKGPKVGVDW